MGRRSGRRRGDAGSMFAHAGSALGRAAADAVAILLPVRCSGCGLPDHSVCDDCAGAFAGEYVRRSTSRGTPVLSGARYDEQVAHVLAAYKDEGRTDAVRVLGHALDRVLRHALEVVPPPRAPLVLVPVPSSGPAYRRRGYDPLRLIAARARIPIVPALTVARRTADQALLNSGERAANVHGAFRAARSLDGAVCVLFDDVVTTGASLDEAERALLAAGARVHLGATIAATPLRRAPIKGVG